MVVAIAVVAAGLASGIVVLTRSDAIPPPPSATPRDSVRLTRSPGEAVPRGIVHEYALTLLHYGAFKSGYLLIEVKTVVSLAGVRRVTLTVERHGPCHFDGGIVSCDVPWAKSLRIPESEFLFDAVAVTARLKTKFGGLPLEAEWKGVGESSTRAHPEEGNFLIQDWDAIAMSRWGTRSVPWDTKPVASLGRRVSNH